MKFYLTVKDVIGPYQFKALKMLIERGPKAVPRPGEVTPTGKLRFHTFTDLVPRGWAKYEDLENAKIDPRTGLKEVQLIPTKEGRRVFAVANVTKPPRRRSVKARPVSAATLRSFRASRKEKGQRLHS